MRVVRNTNYIYLLFNNGRRRYEEEEVKYNITPSSLLDTLQGLVDSSEGEEKKKREHQLAGAKAMNEVWTLYRKRWSVNNKEKIREYNREYARKHRGTNEEVNYNTLTVVERSIMDDVYGM